MGLLDYTVSIEELIFEMVKQSSESARNLFKYDPLFSESTSLKDAEDRLVISLYMAKRGDNETEEFKTLKEKYLSIKSLLETEKVIRESVCKAANAFADGQVHPILDFIRVRNLTWAQNTLIIEVTKHSASLWAAESHSIKIADWASSVVEVSEDYPAFSVNIGQAQQESAGDSGDTQIEQPAAPSSQINNDLVTLYLVATALGGLIDKDIERSEVGVDTANCMMDDSERLRPKPLTQYVVTHIEGRLPNDASSMETLSVSNEPVEQTTITTTTCILSELFSNLADRMIGSGNLKVPGIEKFIKKSGYVSASIQKYLHQELLKEQDFAGQGERAVQGRLKAAKDQTRLENKTSISTNQIYNALRQASDEYLKARRKK